MEDTLRDTLLSVKTKNIFVLILVLMEDTLRVKEEIEKGKITSRLNPCFNGRYSQSI